MRKRYIYNTTEESEQRYRIRNRFTNRTATIAPSSTTAFSHSYRTNMQISPPLPKNNDDMEVQYDHKDDDMISQYEYDNDDIISQYAFDNLYNEEEEEEEGTEEGGEEEEEEETEEGGEEEEEEETEEGGEEEEEEAETGGDDHRQIVDEALDKNKMPSYNGDGDILKILRLLHFFAGYKSIISLQV